MLFYNSFSDGSLFRIALIKSTLSGSQSQSRPIHVLNLSEPIDFSKEQIQHSHAQRHAEILIPLTMIRTVWMRVIISVGAQY